MKSFKKMKVWLLSIGSSVALFILSAAPTYAQTSGGIAKTVAELLGIGDITAGAIELVGFVISYTIAIVAGVAVAVEAWLIEVILNLNDQIFQTVFVQSGFSIALSIANLAFVLGIIVIAIATIIRNESYGIKKLLWKLVVAAILVNFGLVIAAPIFGTADSFTHYFLNCISPTAGGCNQNFTGLASYDSFATTFAGAFQPQNSLANISSGVNGTTNLLGTNANGTNNLSSLAGAFSAGGASFGGALSALIGVFFTAINLILVVGVLGGFLVLMFIRYIYIAVLAVLMPFAWAAWVFPGFEKHWKTWWDKFLKWTFFAPLALFFIYLSMLLMQAANGATGATAGTLNLLQYQNQGTGTGQSTIFTALSTFGQGSQAAQAGAAGFLGPIMGSLLQELVFAGLIIGGLFAAEKMGIEGSKAVTGTVTHFGSKVKEYSSKKAHQAAGRMIPQGVKNKLQAGQYRIVPKRLQVAAGVGLGSYEHKARAGSVEAESKYIENLAKDPATFANVIKQPPGTMGRGGMSEERFMKAMDELSKNEGLQKGVMKSQGVESMSQLTVGGKNIQKFLTDKKTEEMVHKLHQEKAYGDLKDKTGVTVQEIVEKNKEAEETVLDFGEKARQQELKDIIEKKKAGVALSPSEVRISEPYSERLAKLEAKEKKTAEIKDKEARDIPLTDQEKKGKITTEEKKELADLRTFRDTPTAERFISDEDLKRYNTAKETFDENVEKLKGFIQKSPDLLPQFFQNFNRIEAKLDKAGIKDKPLTLEKNTREKIQASILTAMAEGLSAQNTKEVLKKIYAANNTQYFENAPEAFPDTMKKIRSLARWNNDLAKYVKNNPGKDQVDLGAMFGLKADKKKDNNNDEEEE